MTRCRKLSLVGASPETSLPSWSSFDSRAGSRRPSEALVGVISQPSSRLKLMLPEDPAVRPRAKIDAPIAQIASRSVASLIRLSLGKDGKGAQEKVGRAEIAGFESEREHRLVEARRPSYAGIDLPADPEPGDTESLDDRAGGLAAGDNEAPHSVRNKLAGNVGEDAFDQRAGALAAEYPLDRRDLLGGCCRADHYRPIAKPRLGPGKRVLGDAAARGRRDQVREAEAHDLLAPNYGCFTEDLKTQDLKEAKALLDDLDQRG